MCGFHHNYGPVGPDVLPPILEEKCDVVVPILTNRLWFGNIRG